MNPTLSTRRSLLLACLLAAAPAAAEQSLYKFRGPDGQWHYADRPPASTDQYETRALKAERTSAAVRIRKEPTAAGVRVIAVNEFHCPVQIRAGIQAQSNIGVVEGAADGLVVAALSESELMIVQPRDRRQATRFQVAYQYYLGDPEANHDGTAVYRAPFSRGQSFTVTQAYPSTITHGGTESRYAVDFAMPVGTPVMAARAGTVVQIAYDSFSGGIGVSKDIPKANLVRIVHADGTLAVYAHLRWESIRVRPGDRVAPGERIADSGNTGFSSGPHLHFGVQRNTGMNFESVPVAFAGLGDARIAPATGSDVTSR